MGSKEFSYEYLFQYYSELFVKKFNEALLKSQHTQTSLAKLLNRSPNAIFKWTRGVSIPSHVIEKILCDIFEIDHRYFSHVSMTFEEARAAFRNEDCTMEILKKKVDKLEKKLSYISDKEESKQKIVKMVEAISGQNADKLLPLIEMLYKDII